MPQSSTPQFVFYFALSDQKDQRRSDCTSSYEILKLVVCILLHVLGQVRMRCPLWESNFNQTWPVLKNLSTSIQYEVL
jgi:hypothetical protein